MKKTLFGLLLLSAFTSQAQKVEIEGDKVSVDKTDFLRLEKEGCGFLAQTCKISLATLSGEKEIVVVAHQFNDPTERSQGNPQGRVTYHEFIFLKSKKKAEVKHLGKPEKVIKAIVKAKLFENGQLNETAVDEFTTVNGTPFSERKARR